MFSTKLKIVTATIVLAGGEILICHAPAAPVPAAQKVPKELLEKRRDVAKTVYELKLEGCQAGLVYPNELFGWSERWLKAELALCNTKAAQIAALKAHLKRTRKVERLITAYVKAAVARQEEADAATYERINAEIRLFQVIGKIPSPPVYNKPVVIPKKLKPVKEQEGDARIAPAKDRKELMQQRRNVAQQINEEMVKDIAYGFGSFSDLLGWSERLLEAELALPDKKKDHLACLKAHRTRTRMVEQLAIAKERAGEVNRSDVYAATYERIQADIRYFRATGKLPPPSPKLKIEIEEEEPTPLLPESKPNEEGDKP